VNTITAWSVLGLLTYLVTAALGTSAQLGWVNTRPFRWLHHALFAAVWLTLAAAAWAARFGPALFALAAVMGCMALLPRFRPGTRAHCGLATLGLGGYIIALVLVASASGAA
jgi:hypothetical protein